MIYTTSFLSKTWKKYQKIESMNCKLLKDVNLVPRDIILEEHRVGVGKTEQSENYEQHLAVLALSSMAEPHLLLKTRDLESVTVVLVSVPAVARNKAVEGCYEPALTAIVDKVKSFQIFNEGVGSDCLEGLHLSTIVVHLRGVKLCSSCVGDYFGPACRGALFGASCRGLVVVALDGEDEIRPPRAQSVVKRLVICKFF